MDEFDPEHMLKFTVDAKGEETFFMDMAYKNKAIKVMYLVSNEDPDVDPIISVFMEDPEKNLIYTRLKKSIGQFNVTTKVKGEHKIIFSNLRSEHPKQVTFAFYNQEEDEQKKAELDDEFAKFKKELVLAKDTEARDLVQALEDDTKSIITRSGAMLQHLKNILAHREKTNKLSIEADSK